jgi:osmoprotectant transport system ATP-binding protein
MKHIELLDVSFSNNEHSILDGITASFAGNRVTAILGRSGGGKSTLLQLILGIIPPERGKILINGVTRTYPLTTRQRFKFGYIIQGNGLFPHLTVAENISLPGRIAKLGTTASGARVDLLLNMAGFESGAGNRFPYQLSAAQQLRVLICRAYFPDPDVLLMDEPFNSIDGKTRDELQKEFLRFQRIYPRTVILVTHDLSEARRLADDILILDHGKVQQFGTKQKVLQQPANLSVKHVLQAVAG